jgi:hypothetical protein
MPFNVDFNPADYQMQVNFKDVVAPEKFHEVISLIHTNPLN